MTERQRTALVTGANQGLGLETCRQLAERGFHVILTSRNEAAGKSAAKALADGGLSVEYRKLDVSDAGDIDALAAALALEDRHIDVLVNNAAVEFDGFDADVARNTLAVNFFGVAAVTDRLRDLVPEGGIVVMVSSGAGELSQFPSALRAKFEDPAMTRESLDALMRAFVDDVAAGHHSEKGWPSSAYRVSKAGLNALTKLVARELAARNIAVNAVCPGWVRTRMGGQGAPRHVEQGGASIVWAALVDQDTTGGFYRDGKRIQW
jgi:carbonyl reductase 1